MTPSGTPSSPTSSTDPQPASPWQIKQQNHSNYTELPYELRKHLTITSIPPTAHCFVAHAKAPHETQPLGILITHLFPSEAEIIDLAVLPTFRHRGIAKTLLTHLLHTAKLQGITTLLLDVHEHNIPAKTLYQKLGFTTITTRKNYYQDGGNALVMKYVSPLPKAFSPPKLS